MQKDIQTSVYERLQARLRAKASSLLQDDDKARDILQESFYRLWKRRASITGTTHAEGMLTATVRNLSIDMLRRENSHPTTPLADDYNEYQDSIDEERQQLFHTVEQIIGRHLSQRDRDILLKRDRDGWEFSEIAAIHGMTEGNVRVVVARARKTVREIYNRKL